MTFRERNDKKTYKPQLWQFYLTLLCHGILLLILINFKEYAYINYGAILLLLFEILIIYFLPWWPYYKSDKIEFIQLIILINVILFFISL